jgi:thiamine kinase-like enzyme
LFSKDIPEGYHRKEYQFRFLDVNRKLENFSKGLSGCTFSISDKGTVTKYSSGKEYNDRLLKQSKKQEYFRSLNIPNIKSPRIFSSDSKNLIYSFEMEYISGNNYLDFLEYSSLEYVNFFLDSIFSYLKFLDKQGSGFYSKEEFIFRCKEKLYSIKKYVSDPEFFNYVIEKIEKIENPKIGKSFCHGDLTLSNILFSVDSLCFLDFLDSYIESWVIDLIKIKQDLFYHWNIKKDCDTLNLRSVQISYFLWEKIEDRYKDLINSEEFKILEVLNFLRIYPYAKTQKEIILLENTIKKTPIYEEFNNPYGGKII